MNTEKEQNILNIFETMFKHNLVGSYVGPLDNDILTLFGENIEDTLWQTETKRRRFFKIFVELAHNISLYSSDKIITKEKEYGQGTILIRDLKDYFLFTAGNLVDKSSKEKLETRTANINNLDRLELRKLKRELRKEGNTQGSGNIGLVQVALLSKNPIEINFYPTGTKDESFFLVSVKLEKD